MPYYPAPHESFHDSVPSNPTGTTSTTLVMMGLAKTIIPRCSGRIIILCSGNCKNDTTGDGIGVQLSYGTGSAPSNGGALAGTQVGGLVTFTSLTGVLIVPFSTHAAPVLTIGTTYWIDLAVKAITAGTATVTNLMLTVFEH